MRIDVLESTIGYMDRTLLIVDDHAGFRSQVRALFASAGYRVVGEAADGATGVLAAAELSPDIVLLDIQLPDMSGFDVADLILQASEHPAIVLISSRDASDLGRRLGQSGARAFIPKGDLSVPALEAALGAVR